MRGIEMDTSSQRVERGKQLVLHEHIVVTSQRAHQRAFACVRVADKRDDGHALSFTPPPVERPLLANVLNLFLQLRNLLARQPAVRLNLRLTRSADTDRAWRPTVAR